VGKDEMVAVTVIASGSDDQTLLEQSSAVYALGIIGQDVPFGNIVDTGHRGTLAVTFSAQDRNIHFVSLRPDIAGRKDRVFTMALAAGRRIGRVPLEGSPVNPVHKFSFGDIMTDAAADLFQPFRMGEIVHFSIHMAADAV